MTREEVKKVIQVMCDLYPNFHPADLTATVNAWEVVLRNDRAVDIQKALIVYSRTDTSGFAPTVSQLVALTVKQADTCGEEWLQVRRAICNSTYHAEEEFEKLSPLAQRCVGSPWQLTAWARTDEATIDSSVAKHFRETYKALAERQQNELRLGMAEDLTAKLTDKGATDV